MATKRKPATKRGKKASPPANVPAKAPPRARKRAQVLAPEPPLKQGLLEMATIGAQSFLWLVSVVGIFAVLAGGAYAVWSLRPIPEYTSDAVTIGSPFTVTFRVENTSTWFALAHPKIKCALTAPEAVVDVASRLPERLEPGQSALFTCPFHATTDDPDMAPRAELYFRSTYDAPLVAAFRIADNHGPFVLNTKLLPPRWTAKPGKD